MSTARLDRICPHYVGSGKITVQLDTATTPPYAYSATTINIDYSSTGENWVSLPIEIIIAPSSADSDGYIRKKFTDAPPESFTWRPTRPGSHLVIVRELFHNQYQGKLEINVEGDPASTPVDPLRRWARY